MSDWNALRHELDAWAAAKRAATLWWRDDDAAEPTPALAELLDLGRNGGVPLVLAVIPALASDALAAALAAYPTATPVQHGYAHRSHAEPGAKNGELGPARLPAVNLAELTEGRRRMQALFGARGFPALVPPWNRIDPGLLPHLPPLGFRGLSTFGPRAAAEPVPGLRQANTHLDIIDWRGSRGFVGEAKALVQLIDHLRARRRSEVDRDEPSGLLTHHLVHDRGAWDFIAALFAATRAHPAAIWLAPERIFAPSADDPCLAAAARPDADKLAAIQGAPRCR